MLLKRELLEDIKAGKVDLVFRRWSRPTVRAGGTLKTKIGILSIDAMDEMDPANVTLADAQRAGFADLDAFRRWLDSMKPGHLFHRIQLRYLGEDQNGTGA
ncbi:MAG: hypothetical protein K0R85_2612 [Devosia sp.]|nr:hypothetical protein [Devosia sp.]